jgi:hypothetical protein
MEEWRNGGMIEWRNGRLDEGEKGGSGLQHSSFRHSAIPPFLT